MCPVFPRMQSRAAKAIIKPNHALMVVSAGWNGYRCAELSTLVMSQIRLFHDGGNEFAELHFPKTKTEPHGAKPLLVEHTGCGHGSCNAHFCADNAGQAPYHAYLRLDDQVAGVCQLCSLHTVLDNMTAALPYIPEDSEEPTALLEKVRAGERVDLPQGRTPVPWYKVNGRGQTVHIKPSQSVSLHMSRGMVRFAAEIAYPSGMRNGVPLGRLRLLGHSLKQGYVKHLVQLLLAGIIDLSTYMAACRHQTFAVNILHYAFERRDEAAARAATGLPLPPQVPGVMLFAGHMAASLRLAAIERVELVSLMLQQQATFLAFLAGTASHAAARQAQADLADSTARSASQLVEMVPALFGGAHARSLGRMRQEAVVAAESRAAVDAEAHNLEQLMAATQLGDRFPGAQYGFDGGVAAGPFRGGDSRGEAFLGTSRPHFGASAAGGGGPFAARGEAVADGATSGAGVYGGRANSAGGFHGGGAGAAALHGRAGLGAGSGDFPSWGPGRCGQSLGPDGAANYNARVDPGADRSEEAGAGLGAGLGPVRGQGAGRGARHGAGFPFDARLPAGFCAWPDFGAYAGRGTYAGRGAGIGAGIDPGIGACAEPGAFFGAGPVGSDFAGRDGGLGGGAPGSRSAGGRGSGPVAGVGAGPSSRGAHGADAPRFPCLLARTFRVDGHQVQWSCTKTFLSKQARDEHMRKCADPESSTHHTIAAAAGGMWHVKVDADFDIIYCANHKLYRKRPSAAVVNPPGPDDPIPDDEVPITASAWPHCRRAVNPASNEIGVCTGSVKCEPKSFCGCSSTDTKRGKCSYTRCTCVPREIELPRRP